jgi:hypothetical protein
MNELSNAEKLNRLRHGAPGVYEFQIVIGESYETFETLMVEARELALRFHGIVDLLAGTYDKPEVLRVEIKA